MLTKPEMGPSLFVVTFAACVATVIGLVLLASVTGLFQSRGLPMGDLAAAERACAQHAYVSEREVCMRDELAARDSGQWHGALVVRTGSDRSRLPVASNQE